MRPRKLAWSPLLSAEQIKSPELIALFAGNKKDADISQKLSKIQGDWNSQAKTNYEKAQALAKEAATL